MSLRDIKPIGLSDLPGQPPILQEIHSCDSCGAEWSFSYTTDYSISTMIDIAHRVLSTKRSGDLCPRCRGVKQKPGEGVQIPLFALAKDQ